MGLTIIVLISSLFIIGGEFIKRKFSIPTNITRRIIHIGTSCVAGIAPFLISKEALMWVCIFFGVILFLGRSSNLFSAIHNVKRHTFGEIYLPLGIILSAFFFLPNHPAAFLFGILVMGISDPIAGLIGERFGKFHFTIFKNKKSIEGSFSFFMSTLILISLFTPTLSFDVILVSTLLTFTEALLIYGLDNLVLPIMGAFLFQFFLAKTIL